MNVRPNALLFAPLFAGSALAWFVPNTSILVDSVDPSYVESLVEPAPANAAAAPAPLAPPLVSASSTAVQQALLNALPGWAFVITSVSSADAGTVSAAQEQRWIDIIVNQGSYPSLSAAAPANLATLLISQDPTITPQALQSFRAQIDAIVDPGDTIVRTTWVSVTAGTFETYAICNGSTVQYEPFLTMVTNQWPPAIPLAPSTQTGNWPPSGGSMKLQNGFGVNVCTFNITATAHCEGGELIGCAPPQFTAAGTAFAWTASGSATSQAIGNCCVANVTFGYASGFKKVKVGGSGGGVSGSVEIEGSIGCGGTFSRSATACCD